jgi:hypothetical protein
MFPPLAAHALSLHFPQRHDKEGGKRDRQQSDGRDPMQLVEAIGVDINHTAQPEKHKKQVRAEDLQRSLPQREDRCTLPDFRGRILPGATSIDEDMTVQGTGVRRRLPQSGSGCLLLG